MSACISGRGEYGEHTWDENHWCSYCGVYNDVWQEGRLKALDRKLALIEVVVALWEAGARHMDEEVKNAPDTESELPWQAKADVNRAHAESIRHILSEG